jgi:hypothetical protein
MAHTKRPGATAAESVRVTRLHKPPPKGVQVGPEEDTAVQDPEAEAGTEGGINLFVVIATEIVTANAKTLHSPVQSKIPDTAGRVKELDTATLSEENDASTVKVKLRGVVEDVVATAATTAALTMPDEMIRRRANL